MDKEQYITFTTSNFTSSWLEGVAKKADKSVDVLINQLIDNYLAAVENAFDVQLKVESLLEENRAV